MGRSVTRRADHPGGRWTQGLSSPRKNSTTPAAAATSVATATGRSTGLACARPGCADSGTRTGSGARCTDARLAADANTGRTNTRTRSHAGSRCPRAGSADTGPRLDSDTPPRRCGLLDDTRSRLDDGAWCRDDHAPARGTFRHHRATCPRPDDRTGCTSPDTSPNTRNDADTCGSSPCARPHAGTCGSCPGRADTNPRLDPSPGCSDPSACSCASPRRSDPGARLDASARRPRTGSPTTGTSPTAPLRISRVAGRKAHQGDRGDDQERQRRRHRAKLKNVHGDLSGWGPWRDESVGERALSEIGSLRLAHSGGELYGSVYGTVR